MRIAVTGATGFVGRSIVSHLIGSGHRITAWKRPTSDASGLPPEVDWVEGGLGDERAANDLLADADAVVHAALDRPGEGFRGAEGDLLEFAERNVLGTLRLMEAARKRGIGRFVFISSCAVHDVILPDRPLDETHPTWSSTHYGAHKAAIEAFVGSYGLSGTLSACALRPSGVYGIEHKVEKSKWFGLVRDVAAGRPVDCRRGGKEVHVSDVARAAEILLNAPDDQVNGRAFNCCDRYISDYEVAHLARRISGASGEIAGAQTRPKNQIVVDRIKGLGMNFGGESLLEETIRRLVDAVRSRG